MTIFVDIDGTLCKTPEGGDYHKAMVTEDTQEVIDRVNSHYDAGDTIVIWTARGTVTGIDWTNLTEKQLRAWGVKYHELRFGKPAYDLMVCDKTQTPELWLSKEPIR